MKSPLIVRTSPLNDRYFIDYSHSTVCFYAVVLLWEDVTIKKCLLLYLPSLGTGLMCLSYPSHSGNNLFLINFGIFPFLWRFLKRRPRPPRPRLPASARKANIHKTKNKVATLLVSMLYSNAWKVHKIWKNICRHFNWIIVGWALKLKRLVQTHYTISQHNV